MMDISPGSMQSFMNDRFHECNNNMPFNPL